MFPLCEFYSHQFYITQLKSHLFHLTLYFRDCLFLYYLILFCNYEIYLHGVNIKSQNRKMQSEVELLSLVFHHNPSLLCRFLFKRFHNLSFHCFFNKEIHLQSYNHPFQIGSILRKLFFSLLFNFLQFLPISWV